ncbi:MAG: ribonuclease Y [Candidatus Lindowbacteria bacterium RIFCSPLOWO2_12_FULL_62_27]|nr:MAG: ribonuclease Y [Candidatus Lindowbacteria bacterium RIFCSPLOWO2_12_FULL_62_27]
MVTNAFNLPPLLILLVGWGLGIWFGYFVRRWIENKHLKSAEDRAQQILIKAGAQAEELKKEKLLEGREVLQSEREELEQAGAGERMRIQEIEHQVLRREEFLDKREAELRARDEDFARRVERQRSDEQKLKDDHDRAVRELERISHITAQEARDLLVERMTAEARLDAARYVKKIESEAKRLAERKAQTVVTTAIQRLASNVTQEYTISVVTLPSDEMKGRIIGREGRNIREFEKLTGVDIIIDDTPETVVLSSFDPYRREVAKLALERLIADGRIHPARIEEILKKVEEEMHARLLEIGERALYELGVTDVPEEEVRMIGRLHFRTSYGQNVLEHSKEVAYLASVMAAEVGANVKMVRRIGLLHDLGKVLTQEAEGPHAVVGAEFAAKHGETGPVTNGIAAHHGECDATTIESVLIAAADAISAARPGARQENVESYIKRLESLEQIAREFPSVEKAYAIQAGREIRAILRSEHVTDAQMEEIARSMAQRIEKTIDYPGQIKVICIRESRIIEYAR